MKDFLLPFAAIPVTLAAITQEELSFWERMLEKWGIGLVGLALFCALAYYTHKREEKLQKERDKRDLDDRAERVALATENNRLNGLILETQRGHATRMEQLVKDQTKAQQDTGMELKNLVRKMRRPCVDPNTESE